MFRRRNYSGCQTRQFPLTVSAKGHRRQQMLGWTRISAIRSLGWLSWFHSQLSKFGSVSVVKSIIVGSTGLPFSQASPFLVNLIGIEMLASCWIQTIRHLLPCLFFLYEIAAKLVDMLLLQLNQVNVQQSQTAVGKSTIHYPTAVEQSSCKVKNITHIDTTGHVQNATK